MAACKNWSMGKHPVPFVSRAGAAAMAQPLEWEMVNRPDEEKSSNANRASSTLESDGRCEAWLPSNAVKFRTPLEGRLSAVKGNELWLLASRPTNGAMTSAR